jgi:uncharacterized RDD family membrane protein YckC
VPVAPVVPAAAGAEPVAASPPTAYAGLVTRVLAFAADAVVINVVGWFVAGVVTLCLSMFNLPEDVKDALVLIGAVIGLVWSAAYWVFFWSTTGQTPGNRLLRIRVLDASTGEPLRPLRALARVYGMLLSALLLCTGFALILFDSRRRALHDRLVGSVVADVVAEPPPIRSDVRAHQLR